MPTRNEIEILHGEAVALANRARAWFDGPGRDWRNGLSYDDAASVAIETLAITARLLAIITWSLDRANHHADTATAFRSAPGLPLPPVLAGTPGGYIAAQSRSLGERLAAASQSVRPVISARYQPVWRA